MKVNLHTLYPTEYKENIFVEVSTEVWEVIQSFQLNDSAYERRMYRYNAHYSLDCEDGIENSILSASLNPEEILENERLKSALFTALQMLPPAQKRRIYARFYLDRTIAEIAQKERVDQRRVSRSIQRGLERLAWMLKIK